MLVQKRSAPFFTESSVVLYDEHKAQHLWRLLKTRWRKQAACGKPLSVMVLDHGGPRAKRQEILYWSILREISRQAWLDGQQYAPKVWNEHFKGILIGLEEMPSGETKPISWAHLTASEFSDYLEKVSVYAIENLDVVFEGAGCFF